MIEATEGAGHRHTALKGGNVQGAPTVGGGVGGKLVGVAGLKAVDLVLEYSVETTMPGGNHMGGDGDAVEGVAQEALQLGLCHGRRVLVAPAASSESSQDLLHLAVEIGCVRADIPLHREMDAEVLDCLGG